MLVITKTKNQFFERFCCYTSVSLVYVDIRNQLVKNFYLHCYVDNNVFNTLVSSLSLKSWLWAGKLSGVKSREYGRCFILCQYCLTNKGQCAGVLTIWSVIFQFVSLFSQQFLLHIYSFSGFMISDIWVSSFGRRI